MALTDRVTDWDGQGYAQVSGLQRTVAQDALSALTLDGHEWVLDIGCGDGFLTRAVARMVGRGYVVGVDPSSRMLAEARRAAAEPGGGPGFVRADARQLPFTEQFDVVVSFNALHWVRQQGKALTEIATALRMGGRAVIQMVCACERPSVETTAVQVCHSARWARWFDGFTAPFVHVEPAEFRRLAASAGLTVTSLTVTDREWDFGSREQFTAWCTVGSTSWTDRLPAEEAPAFIDDLVEAYKPVAGRPGLFRFTQMRAELRK